MKVLFFLLDGLGDERYRELGGKTPLEHARTLTFNYLANFGSCGLLIPEGLGKEIPMSDASSMLMATLGYDVREVKPARGVVEAIGAGLNIKDGDLCMRVNFATVDKNRRVVDLRAGRIHDTKQLERAINGIEFDVPFIFKSTTKHRGILVFKGDFSDKITPVDPHKVGAKVMKARGGESASLVNDFLEKAHEVLSKHSLNKGKKLPANFILPRGFGSRIPEVEPFARRYFKKACGLTGLDVDKGILKLLGIDLIEVPEDVDDELTPKRRPLEKVMKRYDFVFVHFKNIDTPSHDGNFYLKKENIEKDDAFIGSLDLDDKLIVATSDHSTSCRKKSHTAEPIPTLVSPTANTNLKFGERYCRDFKMPSFELMKLVKSLD